MFPIVWHKATVCSDIAQFLVLSCSQRIVKQLLSIECVNTPTSMGHTFVHPAFIIKRV